MARYAPFIAALTAVVCGSAMAAEPCSGPAHVRNYKVRLRPAPAPAHTHTGARTRTRVRIRHKPNPKPAHLPARNMCVCRATLSWAPMAAHSHNTSAPPAALTSTHTTTYWRGHCLSLDGRAVRQQARRARVRECWAAATSRALLRPGRCLSCHNWGAVPHRTCARARVYGVQRGSRNGGSVGQEPGELQGRPR